MIILSRRQSGLNVSGWESWARSSSRATDQRLDALLRIVRSSMLEVVNLDYVRTERAKGVSECSASGIFAVNDALPLVTWRGDRLSWGRHLTETVFAGR